MRDPGPTPAASVGTRSGGEAGVGRKKTLLLGWLTRGVRLAAGVAQARRDTVKRYGWQVGPTVSVCLAFGWRGEAGPASWAACASGRAGGLARKAKQAWAAAAPYSFLSLFLFFFYFVFLSLLFVANLFRV